MIRGQAELYLSVLLKFRDNSEAWRNLNQEEQKAFRWLGRNYLIEPLGDPPSWSFIGLTKKGRELVAEIASQEILEALQ